jgi:hypothetical protein
VWIFKISKEILSNRRKLEEEQTVTLTEKESASVMNKLLSKLRDISSFSVICAIDNIKFYQILCDFDASVSFMSKSMLDRICVGN